MKKLSRADRQLLFDGVKRAVELVDSDGLSPDDAMYKVAEELNYTPGFLRSACSAFNTGRQLSQWKTKSATQDKLASFPLADFEAINARRQAKEKQGSVAESQKTPEFFSYDEYFKRGQLKAAAALFEKKAAVEVPERGSSFEEDYAACLQTKKAMEEYRRKMSAAEDLLNFEIHKLNMYFKQYPHDRLKLATVEKVAEIYHGIQVKGLLDYVAQSCSDEKRAADYPDNWQGFNVSYSPNKPPYSYISNCIKRASSLNQATADYMVSKEAAIKASQKLASRLPEPVEPAPELSADILPLPKKEKVASIWSGLAGGLGLSAGKSILSHDDEAEDKAKIESNISKLESPSHMNDLRKVRAQTGLVQLLYDPSSPLSKYDKDEVLQVYNDIIQTTPSLADQPAAIGPILNRRMLGNTEPFEITEMINIEDALQKTQRKPVHNKSTTDIMKNEASIIS